MKLDLLIHEPQDYNLLSKTTRRQSSETVVFRMCITVVRIPWDASEVLVGGDQEIELHI